MPTPISEIAECICGDLICLVALVHVFGVGRIVSAEIRLAGDLEALIGIVPGNFFILLAINGKTGASSLSRNPETVKLLPDARWHFNEVFAVLPNCGIRNVVG